MTEAKPFWEEHREELAPPWATAMLGVQPPSGMSRTGEFIILAAAFGITQPESLHAYCLQSEAAGKDHGVDWAIARFKQVGQWTSIIWSRAEKLNPELHSQLIAPVDREGKAVGKHEPGNVPQAYFNQTSAICTPTGWGAPRLLALLAENDRSSLPNEILDSCLIASTTPPEFLARLAESVYLTGIAAGKVIDFVLKSHIAEEQNSWDLYFNVVDGLPVYSPQLWQEAQLIYERDKTQPKPAGWVRILDKYSSRLP